MAGEGRGTPGAAGRPATIYDADALRRVPGGIASRRAPILGAPDATAGEVTQPAGRPHAPDGRG